VVLGMIVTEEGVRLGESAGQILDQAAPETARTWGFRARGQAGRQGPRALASPPALSDQAALVRTRVSHPVGRPVLSDRKADHPADFDHTNRPTLPHGP